MYVAVRETETILALPYPIVFASLMGQMGGFMVQDDIPFLYHRWGALGGPDIEIEAMPDLTTVMRVTGLLPEWIAEERGLL